MSSDYTGGLFQHVPFKGTIWIWEVVRAGFTQPQIQAMLVILFLILSSLCFCFGWFAFRATYRRIRKTEHKFRKTEQLLGDLSTAYGDSNDHSLDSSSMNKTIPVGEQTSVSDLLELISTQLKQSRNSNELQCMLPTAKDVVNPPEDYDEEDPPTTSEASVPSLPAKEIPSVSNSLPDPFYARRYKRRIILMSAVAALFVACFLAHFVSLVVAIRSEHQISRTAEQLPTLARTVSINVAQFGNFAIDVAFDLAKTHITTDTARINNNSHLRPLVKGVEELVSEAIACLVTQCHAVNTTKLLLWSRNVSEINAPEEKVNDLAVSLLKDFELILRQLAHLNDAALEMTDEFIHNVTRDWYAYQKSLWTLTSSTFSLLELGNWTQDSRLGNTWFRRTQKVICDYLTTEHLDEFVDCNEVTQFLHRMFDFVEHVPFMLPQKRLDTVVQFTFIPRALGVEQLVEKWLPVATDLPGQGALLLLNTFLQPDISHLKGKMDTALQSVPSDDLIAHIATYKQLFSSSFVVLFTLLVTCSVLLLILFLLSFVQKLRNNSKHMQAEQNLLDPTESSGSVSTTSPSKVGFGKKCTSFVIPFSLTVVITFSILTAVISIALSYASGIVHSELCVYLFEGPAQRKADFVLTERLNTCSRTIPIIKDIINLEHLNLQFPYPILQTLDSEYQFGQTALLPRLHMAPPLNFSALLRSDWLTTNLDKLWESDVRKKLLAMDMRSKIPKISLISIFNQAKKTTNLEKSFDQLEVGTVQDYLNDPGPTYFYNLTRVLNKIGTETSLHLSKAYSSIDQAQTIYAKKYHLAAYNLRVIEDNKAIIVPISRLIGNASIALNQLNTMSNMQIVDLLDQVVTDGWPRILPTVDEHFLPFLYDLLHEIIPFPGLRTIYHQAVSPICPDPENRLIKLKDTPQVSINAINPELGRLGTSLFVSSITLLIASVLSWFVL